MGWDDERIAERKNEERKKKYINLETGMYVKGQRLYFHKEKIENLKLLVFLPTGFGFMEDKEIRKRYPTYNRPEVVVGNTEKEVTFAFSVLENHIADESLREGTVNMLKTLLRSANPSIAIEGEGAVLNGDLSCRWLGFKSYIIGGTLYNLMGIVSFPGRTILGMFSCPHDLSLWWNSIFLKILENMEEY